MSDTRDPLETRSVQLSILDTFSFGEGAPRTRSESVRRLKAALRRDLEWLLNTRRPVDERAENQKQVQDSVYWFGLPDFAGVSLNSQEGRAELLQGIQSAITRFEPRLTQVRVRLVDDEKVEFSQVRFVIDALLRMEPISERVSFDTVMEILDGKYRVRGERG